MMPKKNWTPKQRLERDKSLMLTDIRNAPTQKEKREIITKFNPFFYTFGTELDPKNPYENETEEMLCEE